MLARAIHLARRLRRPGVGVNNVTALPYLDERRRAELQHALDGVPLAIGYAAGIASQLLKHAHGPRQTARRLEELRRQWHHDVDHAITWALEDRGQAS
jgi:hypothetical protein